MASNAAAMHLMRYSKMDSKIGVFEIAGCVVWFIGFMIEVEGDRALTAHRNNPECKGKLIYKSFWRYTRHPNYFGECMLWWGVYIVACGSEGGWVTVYAPIFISLLIRFLSGVTMLEKKQVKKAEFRIYMMETNIFFPWISRPITDQAERDRLLIKFQAEIDAEPDTGNIILWKELAGKKDPVKVNQVEIKDQKESEMVVPADPEK